MPAVPRGDDHVIVIFGANGDLSRRKLVPALFHLFVEGLMPERFRVVGNSRSGMTDAEFREFARDAVREFSRCDPSGDAWDEFAARLSYVSHDFGPESSEPVRDAIERAERDVGGSPRRLFYLSVPPGAFATITEGLAKTGLTDRARVVYEKPFGTDLESFHALDAAVSSALDESQIYRIDHYMGKETVQNILALRFANGMFEPVWNRLHIDHVQIDVPETLGIGTRAGFYERTGALRDMVVTHLFQVLSFIAMEPPVSLRPKALIDEKAKVFESMAPIRCEDVVRGQYDGYLDEDGVDPRSETETFVAVRAFVDNWRWEGVPFYLRTGKRMPEQRSVVTLAFRRPPSRMFRDLPEHSEFDHDYLALELGGPSEGVSATFLAKLPGPTIELWPARMEFRYEGSFGSHLIEAYERLIHDAIIGDPSLFTRADGIARTWEIVADVLRDPPPLHRYPQGAWGPQAAHELIAPQQWRLPDRDPVAARRAAAAPDA
ncbi:MAG TPA: glucose-6-phosphate dehydrogenase [Actinomycetota bacterium]|nr:glucose-6-phosphate dehydrogenase [Actinomycetota bacterium]